MFQALYIEEEVQEHPLTLTIKERFNQIPHILCNRYGEVFNPKSQNFRLQKAAPSLILAKKFNHFLLETPSGYGIGSSRNFYFSHLLNCIYDCRYCFLQGMYSSANFVLFVNFEDFKEAITQKILEENKEPAYFFSGYDCDSLALEPITHFSQEFLPLFSKYSQSYLELRTKSINIVHLLKREPLSNVIIAFSLTPKAISESLEHKAPLLHRRIEAAEKLQQHGWPVGLRFDPLIYCDDFREIYSAFFSSVFEKIKAEKLHSVSLGPFRLPRHIYKNMTRLYPKEKLFAHSLEERGSLISYEEEKEKALVQFCKEELLKYIPKEIFFPCEI